MPLVSYELRDGGVILIDSERPHMLVSRFARESEYSSRIMSDAWERLKHAIAKEDERRAMDRARTSDSKHERDALRAWFKANAPMMCPGNVDMVFDLLDQSLVHHRKERDK